MYINRMLSLPNLWRTKIHFLRAKFSKNYGSYLRYIFILALILTMVSSFFFLPQKDQPPIK